MSNIIKLFQSHFFHLPATQQTIVSLQEGLPPGVLMSHSQDRFANLPNEGLPLSDLLDRAEVASYEDHCEGFAFAQYRLAVAGVREFARMEVMDWKPTDLVSLVDTVIDVKDLIRRRWRFFGAAYLSRFHSSLRGPDQDLVVSSALYLDNDRLTQLTLLADRSLPLRPFLEKSLAMLFRDFDAAEKKYAGRLSRVLDRDATWVVPLFRDYHEGTDAMDDRLLDLLLGADLEYGEIPLDRIDEWTESYGPEEKYIYEGTPYTMIRELFQFCPLRSGDRFYDLGAGYGRLALYAGLISEAQVVGIEIVSERAHRAEAARRKLGLQNVRIIEGNVLHEDLNSGNVFFLFNPFSMRTLALVGDRLREVARRKKIRIASWGESNAYFCERTNWLKRMVRLGDRIEIFESF